MYVIINISGKQYKIYEYDIIKIEKININLNKLFILNKLLLINDEKNNIFFQKYYLKKSFLICRVLFHGKNKKVNVYKMKRRKHFIKNKNYKQHFTKILIEKFILYFNGS